MGGQLVAVGEHHPDRFVEVDMANIESPASAPGGEVVVYEAPDGEVRVDVRFDRETVWLTQQQMAELFGRDRSVVTRHIRNAFQEGELDPEATSAKFARVQFEGGRKVSREVDHYNLGRDHLRRLPRQVAARHVSSGIWATRTLREHLIRGFTLNERRLAERGLREARDTLDLLSRTLLNQALVDDTGQAVLGPHRKLCRYLAPALGVRRGPADDTARREALHQRALTMTASSMQLPSSNAS